MREELNIFVDPKTQKSLDLKINKLSNKHVVSGLLYNKRYKFPIVNGIPRFVPKSFYKEAISKTRENQTASSFGKKWNEDRFTTFGKSKKDIRVAQEQFMALLGCETTSQLKSLFKNAKRTLNAGCGIATTEFLFNYNPKAERHCIDLSLSVEKAYYHTKSIKNVCLSQASIFELPYPNNTFDVVYSNGVLHHTPDTHKAFKSLVKKVRPGGTIGVYIYNKKPFLREFADNEIRKTTTKMSYAECMEFSKQMTKLGKSFSKIKSPIVIQQDIELLGIKKGKYNLQKFIYDHFVKCWYNENRDDRIADIVNQDWYSPFYASHHSKEEILSWFKKAGIIRVKCLQPKGWEHSGYFVSGIKK